MIRSIVAGFAAVLVLGLGACSSQAEQEGFSSADRAKVEARIAELDRAMSSGNLAATVDVVPPRLFQALAQRAGATEEELKTALRQMIDQQLQSMSVVSYDMDLAAAPPTKTPDGKRTYLLIPTALVMDVPGVGRIKSTSSTLALEDGGEWWLIRVEDQNQVDILKELWPEFAPVTFPAGKTEPVQ